MDCCGQKHTLTVVCLSAEGLTNLRGEQCLMGPTQKKGLAKATTGDDKGRASG